MDQKSFMDETKKIRDICGCFLPICEDFEDKFNDWHKAGFFLPSINEIESRRFGEPIFDKKHKRLVSIVPFSGNGVKKNISFVKLMWLVIYNGFQLGLSEKDLFSKVSEVYNAYPCGKNKRKFKKIWKEKDVFLGKIKFFFSNLLEVEKSEIRQIGKKCLIIPWDDFIDVLNCMGSVNFKYCVLDENDERGEEYRVIS